MFKVQLPHPHSGETAVLEFETLEHMIYALRCLKEGNLEFREDGNLVVNKPETRH